MFRNKYQLSVDDIVIIDLGIYLIKIAIGLSTKIDLNEYLFVRCGTPGYVAPEVINSLDVGYKYN